MLLDTSAWIELFEGSELGQNVKDILISNECYTSITSISEVANWAAKHDLDAQNLIDRITKESQILQIDSPLAILAGKLNFQRKKINKKWGMMDSFVLSTSLIYGFRILTKDSDFKDLSNVQLL